MLTSVARERRSFLALYSIYLCRKNCAIGIRHMADMEPMESRLESVLQIDVFVQSSRRREEEP